MEVFSKIRISIIVEESFHRDVLDLIRRSEASGFTMYNGIVGTGSHGMRGGFSDVDGISKNVEIVTIVGPEVAERILLGIKAMSERGIILITHFMDVQVLRDGHFR